MISMRSIRKLAESIGEEFRPQQVVLFGSYASGSPTPDSDVDLLVIMPFEGRSVNKSVEMRLKLRPSFPVDLIVRTPETVRERLGLGDPFLGDILKAGKVLYEADHV